MVTSWLPAFSCFQVVYLGFCQVAIIFSPKVIDLFFHLTSGFVNLNIWQWWLRSQSSISCDQDCFNINITKLHSLFAFSLYSFWGTKIFFMESAIMKTPWLIIWMHERFADKALAPTQVLHKTIVLLRQWASGFHQGQHHFPSPILFPAQLYVPFPGVRIFYILKTWDLPRREWEYQLLEAFMV
jgi:hypothetical protein